MKEPFFTWVWVGRFAVTAVATALIAWKVSFAVSDYVVKANTSSASEAFSAIQNSIKTMMAADQASNTSLQAAIDTLNITLLETNRAVGGLRDDTTFLAGSERQQSEELTRLAVEVERIRVAVVGSGINVELPLGFKDLLSGQGAGWSAVRAKYGLSDYEPIFLEILPDYQQ